MHVHQRLVLQARLFGAGDRRSVHHHEIGCDRTGADADTPGAARDSNLRERHAQVAWGLTALGADQTDLFRLETDPAFPDQYRWNGEWRRMRVRTEEIAIRIGLSVVGAIPVRPGSAPGMDGRAALPGSKDEDDWRGYIPADLFPRVMDPGAGHLLTANHRPIGSYYPLSLGISTGSMGDTMRSWRLRERLEAGASPVWRGS